MVIKSDKPTSDFKIKDGMELTDEETLNSGYKNFTVVHMKILKIEWSYLHRYGHRRAVFTIDNRKLETKEWLTP